MTDAARERLNDHLEACDDWKGSCMYCGENLQGTLAELTSHQCVKE